LDSEELIFTTFPLPKQNNMSSFLYLQITSNSQGQIKGSVTQKGHEDQIAVFATEHVVDSPEITSGRRRGNNVHGPLIITKSIDKASIPLYNAFNRNEILSDFRLECYKTVRGRVQRLYYTIELENVHIASIRQTMLADGFDGAQEAEIVAFNYGSITWTFADGGLAAQYNLDSRA
jgi:type VI secretion system secreted protein Hcp